MIITKNWDSIIITDLINNVYYKQQYIYYTKKEAILLFKEKFKIEYELQKENLIDNF